MKVFSVEIKKTPFCYICINSLLLLTFSFVTVAVIFQSTIESHDNWTATESLVFLFKSVFIIID